MPVPQTDAGRWDEDSKAIERTIFKELGKIARCNFERYRTLLVLCTREIGKEESEIGFILITYF